MKSDTAIGSVPERLIAAATKLFAAEGFDRTSVQDIVAAADVTKGALYHYFGSKDDLLSEIYRRYLGRQMQHLEDVASSDLSPTGKVVQAARDVVVSTIENIEAARVFAQSMPQLPDPVRIQVRVEQRTYHERFRGLIEQAQRSGDFDTRMPADLVVEFFFGAVHHLSSWYRSDGALTPQQVGAHFADIIASSQMAHAVHWQAAQSASTPGAVSAS